MFFSFYASRFFHCLLRTPPVNERLEPQFFGGFQVRSWEYTLPEGPPFSRAKLLMVRSKSGEVSPPERMVRINLVNKGDKLRI